MHTITGDEPHYLVIADGLLPTFELEQTGPYTREFRNRTIVPGGLAPSNAVPSPSNTHAEEGPRGLFNVHNIGLPIILSVPYLLGGEIAARVAMILMGAAIVWLLAQILLLTPLSSRMRFAVLFPLVIGMPLIPAATQIYPDLPGGLLCLLGVFILLKVAENVAPAKLTIASVALAYLPWLHIRYSLPMGIILLAFAFQNRSRFSLQTIVMRLWLPAAVSVVLLASYNIYAFGNPTGPYSSGDIMVNRIAVMQFLGLLFDQNQGIFIQQPLHFLGLLSVVALFKKYAVAVVTTGLIALSTLGPNSTHWNLYGGWSFSGRFGWTAAVALLGLTSFAIAHLYQHHKRATTVVIGIGLLIQLRILWGIFVQKIDLFPRTFDGWIGTYSTFWSTFETWLPQWRDYRWAYSYVPNYVFIAIACGVALWGYQNAVSSSRNRQLALSFAVVTLVITGAYSRFGDLPFPAQKWAASTLQSKVGTVENLSRTVDATSGVGFITYGPYFSLPKGTYELGVRYSSSSDTSNVTLDAYGATTKTLIKSWPLTHTEGRPNEVMFVFSIDASQEDKFEFRTSYSGTGEATIDWISLRKVDKNFAE